MTPRLVAGLALIGAGVLGVMGILGTFAPAKDFAERAVAIRASLTCPRLPPNERPTLAADAMLDTENRLVLAFRTFPEELNRERLRAKRAACDVLALQFTTPIVSAGFAQPASGPQYEPQSCTPTRGYVGCVALSGDVFEAARGQVTVVSTVKPRYASYGTREVEIAMQSVSPGLAFELAFALPLEASPTRLAPTPDHIIGAARTRLFYRSSSEFGSSMALSGGRVRSETIAVKIAYEFPDRARLEAVLLILLSTLLGIGATLVVEEGLRGGAGSSR